MGIHGQCNSFKKREAMEENEEGAVKIGGISVSSSHFADDKASFSHSKPGLECMIRRLTDSYWRNGVPQSSIDNVASVDIKNCTMKCHKRVCDSITISVCINPSLTILEDRHLVWAKLILAVISLAKLTSHQSVWPNNMYTSKHKVVKIRRKQKLKNKILHRKEGHIDPLDLQLMSAQHLKKRNSDPSANIALSSKKKKKLLKAIKYNERDKAQKELTKAKTAAEVAYCLHLKEQSHEVDMKEMPSTSSSGTATDDASGLPKQFMRTSDAPMAEDIDQQ